MRGTLVSLLQGAVGAGLMGLPSVYKENGLLPSAFFTLLVSGLTLFCLNLLFLAAKMQKVDRYVDLIEKCFGKKVASGFSIVMIVYIFGVIISYEILIA